MDTNEINISCNELYIKVYTQSLKLKILIFN